jgi:tetratricopeptide (TPR) repeat protein
MKYRGFCVMGRIDFKIHGSKNSSKGEFVWGKEYDPLFEEFYEAHELLQGDNIEQGRKSMKALIEKDPTFIDAYNSLGADFLKRDKDKKALEYYLQSYRIMEDFIPHDLTIEILWGTLGNRPFLRTLHGLGLCYMKLHEINKAIELFEALLKYNPNDNQGVRYLLGDLHLANRNFEKALPYFEACCQEYPPCRYSYGACLFFEENYIEAIVQFWLGFYENIYIAHYILNNEPLIAYDCWHGTNFERPEIASDYYLSPLNWWLSESRLRQFLDDLYHSNENFAES